VTTALRRAFRCMAGVVALESQDEGETWKELWTIDADRIG
jgi:hypothetical protein